MLSTAQSLKIILLLDLIKKHTVCKNALIVALDDLLTPFNSRHL